MLTGGRVDAAEIKSRVDIVEVISRYLPLKRAGSEMQACCPFHTEKSPSFKVNRSKQMYHCFGCGASGDVIRFVQDYERVDFGRAVEILTGEDFTPAAAPPKPPDPDKKEPEWRPILPVPDDAQPPPTRHPYRGLPDAIYAYRDRAGRLLGYVWRCRNSKGEKEICPLVWAENQAGERMWRWQGFPVPRPLYGLDRLDGRPVLVVEGEKCADAAAAAQSEFAVVSWPHGGKSAAKAEWSDLAGRVVVLWPDCDSKRVKLSRAQVEAGEDPDAQPYLPAEEQPGAAAMRQIAEILLALDPPADVSVMAIPGPGQVPDGWDVADSVSAGLAGDALVQHIRGTAVPVHRPSRTESDPAEHAEDGGAGPPKGGGSDRRRAERRSVVIGGGRLVDAMREAEQIMFRKGAEPPYFQRAGMGILQAVTRVDRERVRHGGREIIAGVLSLVPVSAGWLRARMMEEMEFVQWHAKSAKYERINLPKEYAESYLDRGDWWAPVLRAVVEAPFVRDDGTIARRPGFDAKSGVYLDLDPAIEWIMPPKRRPGARIDPATDPAVARAKDVLIDLVESYAPEAGVDVSVLLALLLTAIQKPEIGPSPGFMISAPSPGCGKGQLVDICGIVATGRRVPMMTMPTDSRSNADDKEFRQQVSSAVMAGDKFVCIDEVRGTLNNAVLNSYMTQDSVLFRILGSSKNAMLRPTEAIYVALGNNCKVHADAARRFVGAYINPGVARPEEREGLRDTREFARQNRARIVAAALTLMQSYILAGCPPQDGATLGSFQRWADRVAGCLMWAGFRNPIESQSRWREHDETSSRLAALLEVWLARWPDASSRAIHASTEMPAGEVCRAVNDLPHIRTEAEQDLASAVLAVSNDKGAANVNRLGAYLRANAKRVVLGTVCDEIGRDVPAEMWIETTGERKHAKMWTVYARPSR